MSMPLAIIGNEYESAWEEINLKMKVFYYDVVLTYILILLFVPKGGG